MFKNGCYILLLLFFGHGLWAQVGNLSNLRSKTVKVQAGRQVLDTLSIIPSSVQVKEMPGGTVLDSTYFQLDNNAVIWLPKAASVKEPVKITYRVLPFNLGKRYSRLDTAGLYQTNDEGMLIGVELNPYEREQTLIDFKGLDYNGSFSRGISFGNNQDLVLNSSFNLQLAGNLGDGIEILAAITDENIPLQPEGNTQQLREFDRIFIQLKKDNNRLIAGDYELQRPDSYFMNYFKKLQGATFSNTSQVLGKGQLTTSASVAISRGQFARNQIAAQEGNQGPYKLRGSEGERFIIVLAGTEKVFLDGVLLRRGLEEDYIIDYNRGEVTFTNKILITKDSRVVVEFEYTDQSYLRSMYTLNTEYQSKKFRTYFNFFNQQDSKNSTGNINLSDDDKRILQAAGDDFSQAVIPSIDTLDEFNSFRVAYALKDTTITCNGQTNPLQYLEFSTNPDSANYTARFSLVGSGNGNYVLDSAQIANERVYRWVGLDPETCIPQGDYEAVVQLVPPKQQQLLTAGGEYEFSKTASILTEVSLSRNDLNRFSNLDKGDDTGLAAYTTFRKDFNLGGDSSGWLLRSNLSYEFVQETFQALNPYRNPEFLRDWNIANIQGIANTVDAQEQLAKGGLAIEKKDWGSVEYGFSSFFRDSLYTGLRHVMGLNFKRAGWELTGNGSYLSTDEPDKSTRFFRPRFNLVKTFKKLNNWRLGADGQREKSDRYENARGDTLSAASFFFDRYKIFIESPVEGKNKLGLNYSQRLDYAPIDTDYARNTTATEFNVNGELSAQRNLRLAGNFTYRKLEVVDTALTPQTPAETFLGRADLGLNLAKGAIRSNTTYEIGSGQEPKLEFTYVKVNQGEGTHIWLDSLFNNDGVIQQNEMEIAPFQDLADYIKVTTVTDEFIRTDNVNLNQSLQINPRAVWYNKRGFLKFMSKLATQSTLKINRKTQDAPGVSPWNPLQLEIPDTALVAVSSNIRNILFFNRSDPKYDFQVGQSSNESRVVQTSGYESRRTTEQFFRTRWNITKTLSTQWSVTRGERESDSEFFDNKDYRLRFWRLEPQFTFLPGKNFRSILRYKFQQDENVLMAEGEMAQQHDFNIEATYNRSGKSSLRAQFSFVKVQFDGEANSPVGFVILNGLQPGENFLWNVTLNRQLANNIQLNLSYEGRKTGSARVVHVGRAQVAATF